MPAFTLKNVAITVSLSARKHHRYQQHFAMLLGLCLVLLTSSLYHFFVTGYDHVSYHFHLETEFTEQRRHSDNSSCHSGAPYRLVTSSQFDSDKLDGIFLTTPRVPSTRVIESSESTDNRYLLVETFHIADNWRIAALTPAPLPPALYTNNSNNPHRLGGWKDSNLLYKQISIHHSLA